MLTIGIDVGGTFTDLVAIDDSGRTIFAKSPSTPHDQSVGVMVGLEELARRLGLSTEEMLGKTERIVHGTTVATNALLERKGAKVALLTTAGHRDVIEMREGLKGDRYNLRSSPPAPLVPRNLRFGVRERIGPQGEVIAPLDDASLDEAVRAIRESGARSVAVCFLHSYSNPAHEIAASERLAKALPDLHISRSSDVLPQIKEFERVSTTIVNAYVGPAVRLYLTGLEKRLGSSGFGGSLFIILSHGGMAPVDEAWRLAAATVLSGPAGGISGSRRCAELLGIGDLVPFDMGGTSTDISLIADGQASLSADGGLADQRIALRSLDIASIAAGGGSIASVDPSGAFRVGPESAGSVPGPACYGNGGQLPTVTDANLILGYLDAGSFMGGRRPLDKRAAEAALDRLADRLGLTRDKAAAGVFRLVNLAMADGIRLMTLKRGVDPRRFALLSFGGAAGIHAAEVARELEIERIIVPTEASVLSAWGMLTSDLRYEVSRTHYMSDSSTAEAQVRGMYSALEEQASARLRAWFSGPIRMERSAEMRYGEQVFEVDVPLSDVELESPELIREIEGRFHRAHEDLYTYSLREEEVVLVNGRAAAVGVVARPKDKIEPLTKVAATAQKRRRAFFSNTWREVDVYAAAQLAPGNVIHGPAIVEAETTSVIVNEGDRVTVNARRWLDIKVSTAQHAEKELALSA
jgi:N-methylhydantoinase A